MWLYGFTLYAVTVVTETSSTINSLAREGFSVFSEYVTKYLHASHQDRVGRNSAVGVATRNGLDGPGIASRWKRVFPHTSRSTLESSSLLYDGYPGVKWPGRGLTAILI
jgi:hypothetical protein